MVIALCRGWTQWGSWGLERWINQGPEHPPPQDGNGQGLAHSPPLSFLANLISSQAAFSLLFFCDNCSFIRALLCDPLSFLTLVILTENGSQTRPQQSLISSTGFSPLPWYLCPFASLDCIYFWRGKAFLVILPSFSVVPSDLTAEERQELENIRRRKQELLADIQVGAGQPPRPGVFSWHLLPWSHHSSDKVRVLITSFAY